MSYYTLFGQKRITEGDAKKRVMRWLRANDLVDVMCPSDSDVEFTNCDFSGLKGDCYRVDVLGTDGEFYEMDLSTHLICAIVNDDFSGFEIVIDD